MTSRKFTDSELKDALAADGIASAERVTGESYKDDAATMALGLEFHLRNVDTKRRILEDAGDTTFSMNVVSYLSIVSGAGFEVVLEMPFHSESNGYDDVFRIMFHGDGILLCFDTYGGQKSVNSGNLYYNVRFRDGVDRFGAISSGSFTASGVWCGDHDCREAVLFNISQLRDVGEFLNPWEKRPFLWLMHYGDKDGQDMDYKKINEDRIEMLPDHVKQCIGAAT